MEYMNTASTSAPPAAEPEPEPESERVPAQAHASAPPRWLTDEQQRVWRSYMEASTLLWDHLDRQLQRDAGMPHVYYGLLVKLADAPQRRLRMTELAMLAKITRSRLSHAIARLERNGWVRREDCPDDKRGQFAVLTERGVQVLRDTAPGHVEAVRQAMFDRLTLEQQKALGEIMEIVAEGLQPSEAGADLPWLR